MTSIVIIVGVFAFCILMLYTAFNLDKKKHFFLQLIFIVSSLVTATLIPKAVIDYASDYGTATTFFNAVYWIIRVFFGYMFFYIMYELGLPLYEYIQKKSGK